MSITFYPADADLLGTPLLRCACDVMQRLGETIGGSGCCAACQATMNVTNRNASDLLAYLGLDLDAAYGGHVDATQLIGLCEKRLAMDDAEEAQPMVIHSARHVEFGRPACYLRDRCKQLLVIATLARGFRVAWS